MGGQILRFFLKVFSIFIILLIIYLFYILYIKEINFKNNYFDIKVNQNYQKIIKTNILDNNINIFFYKSTIKLVLLSKINVHHGRFKIYDNINFIELLKIITSPTDYFEKITIIEGSSKEELKRKLLIYFDDFSEIQYDELIADTYYINYGLTLKEFKNILNKRLIKLIERFKDSQLLKKFTLKEIFVIASLLEKRVLIILINRKYTQ